ncbi:hypothetical protein L3Q82_023476, partial [Scortum barcoo]
MYFLRRRAKLIKAGLSGDGGRVEDSLDKLLDIMDNASHPLHTVISNQRSLFSERLLLPKCRTNDQQAQELPLSIMPVTLQLLTRGEEDI